MRYKIIFALFFIVWGIMLVRLYHISVKSNYYYEKLAKENIERTLYIKPIRGEITDTSGKLLAMNRIGFSISLKAHLDRDPKRLEKIADRLVAAFPDLNKSVMLDVYKKESSAYNHKHIKVVDFVQYKEMMGAYPQLANLNEVLIETQTKRYYPYSQYAAHIVGYTGRTNVEEAEENEIAQEVGEIGKAGIEKYYNELLQGELGHITNKVTATNKEIEQLQYQKPIDNRNIELTLDMDLQIMIHQRMKGIAGAIVVMRTSGEIVAAVSTPSYNPNLFVGGISSKDWKLLQEDPATPFTNKFVHGTYPPGSTIKMGVAIAASQSPKSSIHYPETCRGFITVGNSSHQFRCWKKHGHGKVELRKSIRESCDVYYYNKSLDMGIDTLAASLNKIGLGVITGVDLPREYSGVIPSRAWKMKRFKKPWYMGETVIAAIGQGYDNVTPLQVARYTALLATSYLVTPHFAKTIDGEKVKPELKPVDIDPYTLEQLRLGMYDVCNTNGGTAFKTMGGLPVIVAGKTGTSQVVSIPQNVIERHKEEDMEYWKRSHAWLTTYAPYDNPRYIVTALVEHGGHGGSANGPIVADIYKWMHAKGYFGSDTNATKIHIPPKATIKPPKNKLKMGDFL